MALNRKTRAFFNLKTPRLKGLEAQMHSDIKGL